MLPKFLQTLTSAQASPDFSRRGFLIAATATSVGFAIGFRPAAAAQPTAKSDTLPNPFQRYIAIAEDGHVTIFSSQFDMGQGSYHGIATLVIEELGGSWEQITIEGGFGDIAAYGNVAWGGVAQGTGGSTSMVTSWVRYRQAAAAARIMLVKAAAKAWSVPEAEITVADGKIQHTASGKTAGFGHFAKEAATQSVPKEIPLKASSDWTVIGNTKRTRYDAEGKTNGSQIFTSDVQLPGLLTAVMIHPPRFGATLSSFEAAKAKAVKGVVDVVAIPRGVAIVAQDMWSALKGRDLVTVTWDESKAEKRGSKEILESYQKQALQPPQALARKDGDSAAILENAEEVHEALFTFPYLAHAAMEPLNAIAHKTEDGILEIWGGHQIPDLYQAVGAKIAGLDPRKVRLKTMKTGGGFGRRAVGDADVISEAVAIAKAIGWKAPVKVQWTRENDMRGGRYRPAYVHRLRASLGKDGKPVAWDNHIVGQSIVAGTPFSGMIQNGVDHTSVEGAANLPYAIPNLSVGLTTTDVKVPVLWWRSVGSTHTAYATEMFIDALAVKAGADPVAYRLDLLQDQPRHAAVLRLAAEKAGWDQKPAPGRFRGVALHKSFESYVAQIAEISLEENSLKVHKVVAAVDVGVAINPDIIKAQVEGSIGFGLGAILEEEITLLEGKVEQENYDSYTPLRLDQMPTEIEVHIVESDASPTGIGEPAVPPIGPAIANALAQAKGVHIHTLPIRTQYLS